MPWSGITSVVTYSAANAIAIPHPVLEPIKVTTIHPGTGGDGIVTLYGSDGKPVATANVSASDPVQTIEFSTASQTLNYSTSAVFASPGLSIIANASQIPTLAPSSDGAALVTPYPIVQADGLLKSNGCSVPWANTRKALMRARIGGGNLRIGIVGDSTVTGMGAVTGTTNIVGCRPRSIGKHFSDQMASVLGLPGNRDGLFGYGLVSTGAGYVTYTTYDPRVVLSAGIGYDGVGGTLGAGPFKFTAAGQVLTFTPDNAFTKIKIYSLNNQAPFGSVRVSVGGVDKADIVSAGGTGFLTTTITASGTAVVITALENKTFDLIGIETWDDTKPGISVLEMGWAGSFISDMASSANAYNHARALASLNLDCVILKCSTNDCIAPTTKAAYKASLQAFLALQPATCDIFFADLFPSSYQDAKPGVLDGYKEAALESGLQVLDLRGIYGNTSAAAIATGLAIGAIHPGEIAYATIAKMYAERLRPWI